MSETYRLPSFNFCVCSGWYTLLSSALIFSEYFFFVWNKLKIKQVFDIFRTNAKKMKTFVWKFVCLMTVFERKREFIYVKWINWFDEWNVRKMLVHSDFLGDGEEKLEWNDAICLVFTRNVVNLFERLVHICTMLRQISLGESLEIKSARGSFEAFKMLFKWKNNAVRQDILLVYALIGLLTFSGKEFKTLIVSLWTVAWGIAYKRRHYWLSPLSWHWAVGPSPEPFNLLKTCIFSTIKLCFPYLFTTFCQFSQIIKSYLQIHKLIFKYSPFQWSITIQTTLLIDLWKPKGILFNTAIEA